MGTSSSQQSQSSITSPWAPAQPALQGILGQLQGLNSNTLSPTALNAINTIAQNGQNANQFTPAINGVTSSLLSGGGALNQAGNVQNAFNQYNANTSGLANNTNYNPLSTPGLKDSLNYLQNQIATGINGQFAAAGRDLSPANTQQLAYGETAGLAPLLTAQYNQNVQNQQAAANNLYNAGNTNAGILSGLQQQYLTNQLGGVGNVSNGLNAQNAGAQATFGATQLPFQTQAGNLGLLAQIGVPIAGLGGQQQGQGTASYSPSLLQQLGMGIGDISGIQKLLPSDRELKQDIQRVGTLDNGLPVYLYRYKAGGPFHIGLMAQDVEKTAPDAVQEVHGYKAVDYQKAVA